MAKRLRERGLALIIVITVLLALVIIATPFVLSMLLQEKTATAEKQMRQADYGADGARNYAAWQMMRGTGYMERRYPSTPWGTYYYDNWSELQVRIGDYLNTSMTGNAKGSIWGVHVQDEQGKINLTSAPQRVIDRFYGPSLTDSRVLDLKDFLTMYSVREARWVFPQRVRAVGQMNLSGTGVYGVRVDAASYYGRDSVLRVTKPGVNPVEVKVTRNWLGSGFQVVETNPQVPQQYDGGIVEVDTRHPVNLNTAPREVLIAMWEGLQLVGSTEAPITRSQAEKLADRFYRKSFDRIEAFLLQLLLANEIGAEARIAVALNAIHPLFWILDNTGTVPMTFKSGDVLTMESFTSVNAPSGVETANRGFREVVSVSPPIVMWHHLESQYDFDSHLQFASALAVSIQGLPPMYGFPYGGKILTSPNLLPIVSDTTLKPSQSPATEAWFQCVTAEDNRGTAQLLNTKEHYSATLEGNELKGGAVRYPWAQVFATYPQGAVPPQQMPDVAAGGIEFWIRFDAAASFLQFFDIRQGATQNRVSLHYDVSSGLPEIVITLADGTMGVQSVLIDNGTAEIRFPFLPIADKTWYHIGAYWKGTRYAHAAILIDGFSSPQAKFKHKSPEGNTIITQLRTTLNTSATTWSLTDNTMVPTNEPSVWLIGSEVAIWDPGTSQLIRGLRGTAAQDHPKDAMVQIFGYSSKLRTNVVTCNFAQFGKPTAGQATLTFDHLDTGGGRVAQGFGLNPQGTVMGDKTDPNPPNQTYIDSTQNFVPFTTADVTAWPQQGHIMIQDEVIYYTGIQTGATPRFTGCERGSHGTLAANHNTATQIRMWGIAASDVTNYIDGTIIQIGDEWFGPVFKDTTHANHWVGYVNATIPAPLLRGNNCFNSIPGSHATGADILPLFSARESDLAVNRMNMGPGDRVTITDAMNLSQYKRINWVGEPGNGWQFSIAQSQLAAFEDNVAQDYTVDDLHTRVLKFPSGELIGLNFLQTTNAQFTIGPMAATIDEIKIFASPKGAFATGVIVDQNTTTVQMNATGGISATGGAIKIGDEIVGFAYNSSNTLTRCVRGYLNSGAQVHDQGDLAFNMSFLPIATLQIPVTSVQGSIRTTGGSAQGAVNSPEGYVLIRTNNRDEVILYTSVSQDKNGNLSLSMPSKLDNPLEGMFRGMFGTTPLDHDPDTLVYFIPYRFWDTYKPQQWDNRMCYYEATTSLDGARWRAVNWTEEKPGSNDPNLVTRLLVRIDGKGEWYDAPGRHLLEYTNATAKNQINRIASQNDPGRLELRFQFQYQAGFWPEHSWKRAIRIKEVKVEYDRPTRILYHEDK